MQDAHIYAIGDHARSPLGGPCSGANAARARGDSAVAPSFVSVAAYAARGPGVVAIDEALAELWSSTDKTARRLHCWARKLAPREPLTAFDLSAEVWRVVEQLRMSMRRQKQAVVSLDQMGVSLARASHGVAAIEEPPPYATGDGGVEVAAGEGGGAGVSSSSSGASTRCGSSMSSQRGTVSSSSNSNGYGGAAASSLDSALTSSSTANKTSFSDREHHRMAEGRESGYSATCAAPAIAGGDGCSGDGPLSVLPHSSVPTPVGSPSARTSGPADNEPTVSSVSVTNLDHAEDTPPVNTFEQLLIRKIGHNRPGQPTRRSAAR